MLVLLIQRNQTEVILVRHVLVEFHDVLQCRIFVEETIELRINDEYDAFLEDVVVAEILVN